MVLESRSLIIVKSPVFQVESDVSLLHHLRQQVLQCEVLAQLLQTVPYELNAKWTRPPLPELEKSAINGPKYPTIFLFSKIVCLGFAHSNIDHNPFEILVIARDCAKRLDGLFSGMSIMYRKSKLNLFEFCRFRQVNRTCCK